MKFNKRTLLLIMILALLVRLIPLDFPKFSADEARIAYRGYTLATEGRDELGRSFPIIFNSSEDYQLPVVSYISVVGLKLFGKTELGARIPFILLGTALVLLTYKIAQLFDPRKEFWLLTCIITAFSPSLIFLSKTPNESIVLTFLFALLFYLLIKKNPNPGLIFLPIILAILSSKFAWFIVTPFVMFTLIFLSDNLLNKTKIKISLICISLSLLAFIIFWQIPQGKRSLMENDFSTFNDVTIKNGIDTLRGQGLESHWPQVVGKVIFNKVQYPIIGFLNWLSQIQPSVIFGQFDEKNVNGFINSGALQKILIIPFLFGVAYIIKREEKKYILLLVYAVILTFPLIFTFSNDNLKPVLFTLPFISSIISLGFLNVNRWLKILIACFFVFEIGINLFNLNMDVKAGNFRPSWIKGVIQDGLNISANQKIAFSDDLTQDLAPYIQWYMEGQSSSDYKDIIFPYRFRQSKISNIKIIGSDDTFYKCGHDIPTNVIASKRDVAEIGRWLNIKTEDAIKKTYKDDMGDNIAYFFEPTICVH